MADRLTRKRQTVSIPGARTISTGCTTDLDCCDDLATPGDYDCETPNLSPLQSTCVMTLSGITDEIQRGMLQIYTLGNTPTACGETYQEGNLEYIRAWAHGSHTLKYLGRYAGTEILFDCGGLSLEDTCDYHIYTYSKNHILAGQISSGGSPTRLESSDPQCCCGTYPHVFYNHTNDEYELAPLVGTYDYSLCGQLVGSLQAPCEIDALSLDPCGSGIQWYSKALVDACVGDACVFPSIPIANGDVYGGLYCDSGTSKIVQYPIRNTWTVYRNVVFWIPTSLTETELCCTDGGLVLQTYVVRRRWYNDGIAVIQGEPTVYTYTTQAVPMEFVGNGTIEAAGVGIHGCSLSFCDATLNAVDIEISA